MMMMVVVVVVVVMMMMMMTTTIESIKTEEAVLFLLNLKLCEIKGEQIICFHILYPGR
jgi:hypothetical protein